MTTKPGPEVIIVGSGLMGAAVARCLRDEDPVLRLLMVDGGPELGSRPGQHLHDVVEPEIWGQYNAKVSTGIQGFYTSTRPTVDVGDSMAGVRPGMYHLNAIGENPEGMPSAAVSWNVGGMGVHWTAATPTPWGTEIIDAIPAEDWDGDLARAADLLRVNPDPYPPTPGGLAVIEALGPIFDPVSAEGRGLQVMPMAVNPNATGHKSRTGPNVIFRPIAEPDADPAFALLTGSLVTELLHAEGRVSGVRIRDVDTGAESVLEADTVVVCADAIRTPQLLFASGIRPPALGRYLNEHAFLTGQVLADPDRLGFSLDDIPAPTDEEWVADCLWVPHSGPDQPFQVHIMNYLMIDEERLPLAYGVGLEVYIPLQVRAENALEFSETEMDAAGMPKITVHFDYSDRDRALIEQGRQVQIRAGRALGDFDPATESALLPPGSSLHFTGTVRMGTADDGMSVCDPDGRVWGFDNLYVAGCGVIPTEMVCNTTLTGMITAVRAARAVSSRRTHPEPVEGSR